MIALAYIYNEDKEQLYVDLHELIGKAHAEAEGEAKPAAGAGAGAGSGESVFMSEGRHAAARRRSPQSRRRSRR